MDEQATAIEIIIEQVHLSPSVYRFVMPNAVGYAQPTNCYFIHDNGEWLLVDAGDVSEAGVPAMEHALDTLRIDRSRLSVFLTHLHLDHCGMLDAIGNDVAAIYASRVEYAFGLKPNHYAAVEDKAQRALGEGADPEDIEYSKQEGRLRGLKDISAFHVTLVDPGDEIGVGNQRLRTIDTSGHSIGHVALYDERHRLLFAGDHILFTTAPAMDLFPEGQDGMQAYLDSLSRVEALGPVTLFQGHGDLGGNVAQRIEALRTINERLAARVKQAIASKPGIAGIEAIQAMATRNDLALWNRLDIMYRLMCTRKGQVILEHLATQGLVVRASDNQGINRYWPA